MKVNLPSLPFLSKNKHTLIIYNNFNKLYKLKMMNTNKINIKHKQ